MMNDDFKLNLYEFLSTVLHKSRYFEDVDVGNQTVFVTIYH